MAQAALPARLLATWFGCGLSPVAPGTVGSLGAVPLHFGLAMLGPVPHVAAIVGLTALGTWAGFGVRLLALGLFRVFDITKPGPIDSVQRLEPAGVGIMADDLLAGVAAGATAYLASALLGR